VNWYDAALYCNARSKLEGLDTVYAFKGMSRGFNNFTLDSVSIQMDRSGYRLPTSAEWEYAARGGTSEPYYWGYDTAMSVARNFEWFSDYVSGTGYLPRSPVGRKRPNPYGLHDMLGSTTEWVNDWFSLVKLSADTTDPIGPLQPSNGYSFTRILRGGSRNGTPIVAKAYHISNMAPDNDAGEVGFRVVRPATIPNGFRGVNIR
jgi:formylglycine-generating enzyme required for sulfatase activity